MVQKCFNHPNKDALSFCHSCNKYYCSDCLQEGNNYYYCNSEICQAELRKEIEQKDSHSSFGEKKRKYGWGWLVLYFIYTKENNIIAAHYGTMEETIRNLSFIIALGFYFLFRWKILIKINKIWLRSFVSGIIAIQLTIPFIYLLEIIFGIPPWTF
jgi:hypothetical protein